MTRRGRGPKRHPGRSEAESRDRRQIRAGSKLETISEDDPGSARLRRSGRDDAKAEASPGFAAALSAVALLAVDPERLGGLRLRGPAGPARDRLLAVLKNLLPPGAPIRKLPASIADGRLLGGLDLSATLSLGRPVMERGLLAEADGGAIVVPSAERLPPGLAGRLGAALDLGAVALERDGFAAEVATRFCVVACDEALADEDPPPLALTERLGLAVSIGGATGDDLVAPGPAEEAVAAARGRLAGVEMSDDAVEALAQAAERLGVFGLRPLIFASAAARASAALAGRDAVDEADLALAARLVLGPRATVAPAPADAEDAPEPDASEPQETPEDGGQSEDEVAGDPREMAERVLEAAAAALPAGLLDGAAAAARTASRASGRAGAATASKRRGRPIGSRPGAPGNGARLDLLDTLRAAAPWQRLRRRSATVPPSLPLAGEGKGEGISAASSGQGASQADALHSDRAPPRALILTFSRKREKGAAASRQDPARLAGGGSEEAASPRILVRREDFRIQRLKERRRTLTIFAVDASGSAALNRLAEAKGAVELLLARAYVRRDEVALIAFRGRAAELLLPPTRSLARAKRALAGLPGGGGTPLASGLDAAAPLAEAARRRGDAPTLVLLTDGAANVARDGSGGRAKAQDEALAAARALKALGFPCVLIDVSPRPQAKAKDLAAAMAARYVALPSGDAGAIARAAAG